MENKKDLEVKQEEVTTNQEPKKILEEEKTVQEDRDGAACDGSRSRSRDRPFDHSAELCRFT